MQIAVIELALGQVGFFDEISKVHLSLENPKAKISSDINRIGLIKAVKDGKIRVVSGSIESEAFDYKKIKDVNPTYYRLLDEKTKQKIRVSLLNQQPNEQEINNIDSVATENILETTTSNILDNAIDNAIENIIDNKIDNTEENTEEVVKDDIKEVVEDNAEEVTIEAAEETASVSENETIDVNKKQSNKKNKK
jgi:hypothetical protein